MLMLAQEQGINSRVELSLCFRVSAAQEGLGIDVQGGGIAAWRIDEALKSIGEGVVAVEWSTPGRLKGWLIADETSEPIR